MRKLIFVLCTLTLFISCQDKVICPAFQSTYILDDSVRKAYFSYVWALDEDTRTTYLASLKGGGTSTMDSSSSTYYDSTSLVASLDSTNSDTQQPVDYYAYAGEKVVPWRVPKRTKYGIAKKVPFFIKNYRMRTAPMENVLAPPKPQEEKELPVDSILIAADSTKAISIDSTSIVKSPQDTIRYKYGFNPKDNYNVEQDYYIKYFGQYLIDTSPIKVDTTKSDSDVPDSLQVKKSFFEKLLSIFKRKKKTDTLGLESDSVEIEDSLTDEGAVEEKKESNSDSDGSDEN